MKNSFKRIWGLGLMLCFLAAPAGAGPLRVVQEVIPGITESTRAKLVAYLARGDLAGAAAMYEAHTGQQAPAWLRNLQVAYNAVNQVPGK